MWAKDLLIIDGVIHPGEMIRRYRCTSPSTPVPVSSNAVLVQLQGRDKFGKLQAISLMRYYRAKIENDQAKIDIRAPSDVLREVESIVLHQFLSRDYPKAYAKAETQAVLALCKVFEGEK